MVPPSTSSPIPGFASHPSSVDDFLTEEYSVGISNLAVAEKPTLSTVDEVDSCNDSTKHPSPPYKNSKMAAKQGPLMLSRWRENLRGRGFQRGWMGKNCCPGEKD